MCLSAGASGIPWGPGGMDPASFFKIRDSRGGRCSARESFLSGPYGRNRHGRRSFQQTYQTAGRS
jgi:hypothetical protein